MGQTLAKHRDILLELRVLTFVLGMVTHPCWAESGAVSCGPVPAAFLAVSLRAF